MTDCYEAIGIEYVGSGERYIALVTSSPKHFREAVKRAIHAFVAARHRGGIHAGNLGDFFGELMIPKFPAQSFGQLLGNFSATASEFAFNSDDAIHNPPLMHGNFSPRRGLLHKEDQGNHA